MGPVWATERRVGESEETSRHLSTAAIKSSVFIVVRKICGEDCAALRGCRVEIHRLDLAPEHL
jgi:hypothetical protein